MKKAIILCLCIVFSFVSAGCSKTEKIPLKDGSYFIYTDEQNDIQRFKIRDLGDNKFEVSWRIESEDYKPTFSRVIIDSSGKVIDTPTFEKGSLGRDLYLGRQIKLWLPSDKRAVGKEVDICDYIGANEIKEKKTWRKWNVFVAQHGDSRLYFDSKTGFLVGSEGTTSNASRLVLTGTNVEGIGGVD